MNKGLYAFIFLVGASAFYWYSNAQITQQSYEQESADTSNGIQVGFSDADAQIVASCTPSMRVSIMRNLKTGMKGDDVKELQEFLAWDYALSAENIVTGYFGSLTTRWVKELQLDKGLRQTGVVDAATIRAINEEVSASCNG